MNRHRSVLLCVLALSLLALAAPAAAYQWPASLDAPLRRIIQEHGLIPREPGPRPIAAQVRLGESLFFDKILSGNRDIACATCHHPSLATGDALALPIGTGGSGLGPDRVIGAGRPFIPRNAPEVFNRAFPGWTSMFWDSRIQQHPDGSFTSPAGADLPAGLHNVLAVQALFPVTSADEMRGAPGDRDVFGQPNELALIPADDRPAIWDALMQRLLAIPEYEALFRAAYPTIPAHELGFEHAATAIAAFEGQAYTLRNSPWDRFCGAMIARSPRQPSAAAWCSLGKPDAPPATAGRCSPTSSTTTWPYPSLAPAKAPKRPLISGAPARRAIRRIVSRFAPRPCAM
jgi:cytochrome c peroxidase